MFKLLPSPLPPQDLPVEQVPLFVTMGFDDNAHSGFVDAERSEGMRWASEFFASLKNPEGTGQKETYDGDSGSCSFYHASKYIRGESDEPSELVRRSWYEAHLAGHETGCHTRSHSHGDSFDSKTWAKEMSDCIADLTLPWSEKVGEYGLGITREQIPGFRTPFLEYSDSTFEAAKEMGFRYDCSIEEGGQDGHDGTNYLWPYTLDAGSPGNVVTFEDGEAPLIEPVPGLWEVPCHMLVCPPDEECEKYGIETGFRDRMEQLNPDFFKAEDGKITGLDYNCLAMFNMNKKEWLAVLKYTFDLRVKGNRAPFTFGGHTDVYADGYDICPNISIAERREAIEEFFRHVLTYPMVRVVSVDKILDWMENPVPLM